MLAIFLLPSCDVMAQDVWKSATSSWFTAGNWTIAVPTAAMDVQINNGGTAQLSQNGAVAANVALGSNAGNSGGLVVGFLGSASLTVTNNLGVGILGSGTMSIPAGTVTDAIGAIGTTALGPGPSSLGSVTVSGTSSLWNNTSGLIMGAGSLTISGGGTVRTGTVGVGIGGTDFQTSNTMVSGAGSSWVNAGDLTLSGSGGADTITVTSNGTASFGGKGDIRKGGSINITNNGSLSFTGQVSIGTGGKIHLGTGGVAGAFSAGSIADNGTLHFNHTGAVTVSAPVSGAGLVLHDVAGSTSTLTSAAAFTGTVAVNDGTLILKNALGGAAYSTNGAGTLRFDGATVNLGSSAIRANGTPGTGGIEYNNTTVNGGFLRGPGSHTVIAGGTATFNGVTTFNGTVITQNGTGNFNNFTNGGTLTNTANSSANFDGFTNTSSGTVILNGDLSATDFTNNGVLAINNGASLNNGANNLVSGGGSRSTVNTGGVVFISDGTTWELNGGLLVVNGEIDGTLDVNYGALAKGSGNFAGMVNVREGGKFSPGNSPGSATVGGLSFNPGGRYLFEIHDAAGAPGSGFDSIHDLGALALAAGATPSSHFTIELASLNVANDPGLALNFDPTKSYRFVLVHADGGLAGFDAAEFSVDSSGFQNNLAGGIFSVAASGNDLSLVFTPIPEPSAALLLLAVGGGMALTARRRHPGSGYRRSQVVSCFPAFGARYCLR